MRICSFVFFMLMASQALAYGSVKPKLWDQIESSDVIAYVRVESAGYRVDNLVKRFVDVIPGLTLEGRGPFEPSHVAKLKVIERWKGRATKEIAVRFHGSYACPAPAKFEVGSRLIVFASYDEERNLVTNGMRHATRLVGDGDLQAWRSTVQKAVKIQSSDERLSNVGEWLEVGLQYPSMKTEVLQSAVSGYWKGDRTWFESEVVLKPYPLAKLRALYAAGGHSETDGAMLAALIGLNENASISSKGRYGSSATKSSE